LRALAALYQTNLFFDIRGSSGFKTCPVCGKINLDTIPVSDYESYFVHIKEDRGIEIEFNK
jgi:hypothetical protein